MTINEAPMSVLYESGLSVGDFQMVAWSMERLGVALSGRHPPYPWCIGAPTMTACIQNGYCRRDPNCGE